MSDYKNAGKPYLIHSVVRDDNCCAEDGDLISIDIAGNGVTVSFIYKSNAKYESVWKYASATYDAGTDFIVGKLKDLHGQARPFSIALDREQTKPSKIHVYVGAPAGGIGAPDDGSWTGSGK